MNEPLSEAEKLNVVRQDQSMREQRRQGGTTYQERAMLDLALERQGRFRDVTAATVVGSNTSYPAASGPWERSLDEVVGKEPPTDATDCGPKLGYRIDAPFGEPVPLSPSKSSASDAARGATEITPKLPVEVSVAPSNLSEASSSSPRSFSKPLRRL